MSLLLVVTVGRFLCAIFGAALMARMCNTLLTWEPRKWLPVAKLRFAYIFLLTASAMYAAITAIILHSPPSVPGLAHFGFGTSFILGNMYYSRVWPEFVQGKADQRYE